MNLRSHLLGRGMDPSLYNVMYDDQEDVITFFLHNFTGKIVGYQQYRPLSNLKKVKNEPKTGRYFTYLPAATDGFFGMEAFDKAKKTIFIVEGVFKAAMLHRLGYNAFAVLSNDPKRMLKLFMLMRVTHDLVAIGDNDKAGQMLVNCVGKGFKSPMDLDEMQDEDIVNMIKENGI